MNTPPYPPQKAAHSAIIYAEVGMAGVSLAATDTQTNQIVWYLAISEWQVRHLLWRVSLSAKNMLLFIQLYAIF